MRYIVIVAAVLSACAHHEEPTPIVAIDGTGNVSDLSSAELDAITIDGQRMGEVSVWSNGAHVTDGKNGERLGILEFELLVRNVSRRAFELDLSQTSVSFDGEPRLTLDQEYAIAGRRRIEPGDVQRIGIRYKLPSTNTVERLLGFDFAWAFKTPTGAAHEHVTRFRLPVTTAYEASEWMPARYVIYPYEGRKPWGMSWRDASSDEAPADRTVTLPPAQQQFQAKDRANKPDEGDSPNG
jgi:hypothetical protein